MRYRAKLKITYIAGMVEPERTVYHVVNADSKEEANRMCGEYFNEYSLNNTRIKDYEYIPCVEDDTPKPTAGYVMERLKVVNDHNDNKKREAAINELYSAFRKYQPSWDDDNLADVLSYCNDRELDKLCSNSSLEEIVNHLLEELDGEWE